MLGTLGDYNGSVTLFIVVMAAGFAVGAFGHLIDSKATIAVGIGLVFCGVLGLPFLADALG